MKLKIKNKNNTQEEEKTERKQKGFRLKSETLNNKEKTIQQQKGLPTCCLYKDVYLQIFKHVSF